MRYLLMLSLVCLFSCRPNRDSIYNNYWLCKDGYHLGSLYNVGDAIAFCEKDCDSSDVYSIMIDDNFYVYKGKNRIGKITKCNNREMIIVSLDGKQEGYYMNTGEKR